MVNPILQGWVELAVLEIPLVVVASAAVFLRIGTRVFCLRKLFIDDYAIILAYACSLTTYILFKMILGDIEQDFDTGHFDFKPIVKFIKADAVLYVVSILFLKISLGGFFLRIFTAHPLQRTIIYVLIAVTFLFTFVLAVMSIATCAPEVGLLGSTNTCKSWYPYSDLSITWSVLNTVGDLLLAALAVNALWSAQLRRPTKLIACLILTLGTFGCIASMIRLSIIAHDKEEGGFTEGIGIAKWTAIEMAAGITAASLACLRPLLLMLRNSVAWARGSGPSLYEISRANGGLSHNDVESGNSDPAAGKELLDWNERAGERPTQQRPKEYGLRRLEDSITTTMVTPPPRVYGVLPDPSP